MQYASFLITRDLLADRSQRILHFVVDLVIVQIFAASAAATVDIIGEMTNNASMSNWIHNMILPVKIVFWLVIMVLYYALTEFYLSRTVAKYLTKTVVVMEDGSRPNLNTIIRRTLCRLIPIDAFTFFDKDARGWHDAFSHTYVVKKHRYNNVKGHIPFYG